MTNLKPLRTLLAHIDSHERCSTILAETARLFGTQDPNSWYFFLLNRVFVSIIDDPDMFYGVSNIPPPVLRDISQYALNGIDAIERDDRDALIASANGLTNAHSAHIN